MSVKIIVTSKNINNLIQRTKINYFKTPASKLTNFVRYSCNLNLKNEFPSNNRRQFSVSAVVFGTAGRAETTSTTQGLSKLQAQELVLRLNDEERNILSSALHEFQSKLIKEEYEGQLAAYRWRSKYGRPAKLPRLGDVDPTGTYCAVPEDWLKKKCAESVPRPTTKNLVDIAIANSIPFIGFGFLDNFFMLIFGDYIDLYLGSYFFLTTMGAAALGNTLSDILGIGTAFYVERLANKVGFRPPKLSPIQMDMNCSRNAANFGRVFGVTIGCILGMCPLLYRSLKGDNKEDEQKNKEEGSAEEIQAVA